MPVAFLNLKWQQRSGRNDPPEEAHSDSLHIASTRRCGQIYFQSHSSTVGLHYLCQFPRQWGDIRHAGGMVIWRRSQRRIQVSGALWRPDYNSRKLDECLIYSPLPPSDLFELFPVFVKMGPLCSVGYLRTGTRRLYETSIGASSVL